MTFQQNKIKKASNGAPTKFLKSKKEKVRMNRKPAFFTKNKLILKNLPCKYE